MAYPVKIKTKKCNCGCNCNKKKINDSIKEKIKKMNKSGFNTKALDLNQIVITNLMNFIDSLIKTFSEQELPDIPEAKALIATLNEAKKAALGVKKGSISSREFITVVNALEDAAKSYTKAIES